MKRILISWLGGYQLENGGIILEINSLINSWGGVNNSFKFIYPLYFRLYLNWQL